MRRLKFYILTCTNSNLSFFNCFIKDILSLVQYERRFRPFINLLYQKIFISFFICAFGLIGFFISFLKTFLRPVFISFFEMFLRQIFISFFEMFLRQIFISFFYLFPLSFFISFFYLFQLGFRKIGIFCIEPYPPMGKKIKSQK